MKLLTISIAAYNMEKYIEKTLSSLTDERIIDQLEIFVVDDGGTDRTMDIAKTYVERYPQSIIPVHKDNGGYGTTVNYSLEHATGKYFKLLDGDDWFDKEGLYRLIQILKTTDADVVVTEDCKEGTGLHEEKQIEWSKIDDTTELWKISMEKNLSVIGMGRLTYKTKVLRGANLKLPGRIFYTDTIYMAIPFAVAETMLRTKIPVYHYRDEREGNSSSKESRIKHRGDMVEILKILGTFCAKLKEENHPNYVYITKIATLLYLNALKSLLIQNPSNAVRHKIIEFEDEIKALSFDVYRNAATDPNRTGRFLYWMRKTGYYSYWLIGLIPERLKR